MNTKHIFICYALFFVSLVGCQVDNPKEDNCSTEANQVGTTPVCSQENLRNASPWNLIAEYERSRQTTNMVKRLRQAHPWHGLHEDPSARVEFQDLLHEIAKLNNESICVILDDFTHDLEFDEALQELSKLYILNRYICDVPEWVPLKQDKPFGSWRGIPIRDDSVNLLWPLAWNEKRELVIKGKCQWYMGSSYHAVDEFLFLLHKYGRRNK